jgi:energy-coupling factor transporter transmembrane protein EcfT
MIYKLLADSIVAIHLIWIVFMLVGFIYTALALFIKRLLDRWLFRSLHLLGIVYVGGLALLREYCPLTILEVSLREKYNPQLMYSDSFIVHYIEKLIYPEIHPLLLQVSTLVIALFTITVFTMRPPEKIRNLFGKEKHRDTAN